MFLPSVIARAGSAQWDLNPGSGDWNTAANWTPMTVPNASTDIATFDLSNTTAISTSVDTEVDSVVFSSGASAYTITASAGFFTLTISGTGITNSSGITQNFVTDVNGSGDQGGIVFSNSAAAGNMTAFTNNGAAVSGAEGGFTEFSQTSTAGSGTFTNNAATVSDADGGQTYFFDASTAANGSFINNGAVFSDSGGGVMLFESSSTAGSGTFINNGGAVSAALGGFMEFFNTSSAGSATITNNGGRVSGAGGGVTEFFNTSSAGSGTFVNNGGSVSGALPGNTTFMSTSTAGSATLIANGGTGGGDGGVIYLSGDSTGGTARVEVFDNGNLDISSHNAGSVTIGSIEGTGNVFLGANNLTVGSNNLSTTFSGVIQDGGPGGGTGGSLTKIGTGTLSLTNSNGYTGGTLINAGTLVGGHDGALGSGNVSLTASGVTLTLQTGVTNNYIANNATISIVSGATANLNFTGSSDIVGSIILNGVTESAPGTYGSTSSGATFQSAFFSGTGTLAIVPEPATWTLVGLGTGMLALVGFRRRRT
jgi:autotransporter-associated beta strand protein